MSRLVAVSNRVSMPRRGAAPGGLAVGLLAAMRSRGGLWFGWSGEVVDRPADVAELTRKDGITYATMDLSQQDYEGFYLGFSNGALWPLFHYFVDSLHFSDQHYDSYQQVNAQYARELLPLLKTDDLIWIHDFHLIPLAEKLRQAGVSQPLGFFLHVPFPSIEVLRVLPVYGELVKELLAYDVVGFQTQTDLESFLGAVESIWGVKASQSDGSLVVGDRRVVAAVFPIGVDVDAIQKEAMSSQNTDACKRMQDSLLGRKLMIGVDRLDYSKGLPERFTAYERFLQDFPENQNRITYLQIAPLSRTDIRAYSQIREELEQAAGRTNGRFADTDWTPIRYLNRNFSHDVLMAFLRTGRVGLVTPVRDGMNLVAKEFVAAQDPDEPGVLVLSLLAGAARELTEAVLVNPYDARGMAQAIQQAFSMPRAERRERHQAMMEVLRTNDIHAWYSRFVQCMEDTRQ